MAYKSLIADTEIIQGDSSEIYLFGESKGVILDSNWTASIAIREAFNSAKLISRDLPKDTESTNFVLQLTPAETAVLMANKVYHVGVEIKNNSINFNAEVAQFKLKILPQLV